MTTFIPQATPQSIAAVLDSLLLSKGAPTTADLARRGDKRTVRYALAAAEQLGLAATDETFGWTLTTSGLAAVDDVMVIIRAIAATDVVKSFHADGFMALCERVGLSLTTAKRRLSTVRSWAAVAALVPVKPVLKRTHCPECHIALPALVKEECDTCGTVL